MEIDRRARAPWMGFIFFLAALAGVGWIDPPRARADGGFFSTMHEDIFEPQQSAVLAYDAAAGREDLYLSVAFEGTAADFGWVVPVPSPPEVSAAESRLFWQCSELTQPIRGQRGFGCAAEDGKITAPNGLEIYDQLQVGLYRGLLVGSSDAGVLADSLTRWGYLHPLNRTKAEQALEFYTDRGWYFVVFRLDPADHPSGVSRWYGRLHPVHLSFASTEPVYPLRISAVSAAETSDVLLYVCADHRMTFPGASTEYVNHLSGGELRAIRERYDLLGPILTEGQWLTKLRRRFTPEEMIDDLVLAPAETDEEMRWIHYSGLPATDLLLLGLVAGWTGRRMFRPRARERTR